MVIVVILVILMCGTVFEMCERYSVMGVVSLIVYFLGFMGQKCRFW